MRADSLVQFVYALRALVLAAILVVVVVMYTTQKAYAEPVSVNLGGFSYHMSGDNTTTWFHRGLVFQKGAYIAGYLKNSYGNDSWLVSYRVWEQFSDNLHTEFSLGAVRGYDKCFGKFTKSEDEAGKRKVNACFLPTLTVTILTDTAIQPQINLWGNAIVLTGKYTF